MRRYLAAAIARRIDPTLTAGGALILGTAAVGSQERLGRGAAHPVMPLDGVVIFDPDHGREFEMPCFTAERLVIRVRRWMRLPV